MGSLTHKNQIPVINLTNNNVDPNSSSWANTCSDVVRALEDNGCFIATFDKFPLELHEAMFRVAKELFDLPRETKALSRSEMPYLGYVVDQPLAPLYEGIAIQNAAAVEGVEKFTHLMWPNGNPSFSETVLSYSKMVAELDQLVMRMVSETYGIEKDYEALLGSMSYRMRPSKYKPPRENENNLGLVPHTDKNFMSILQQYQKGLEIKNKDGEWISIDPSPSFIFIAGEALMGWSNGRIEAPLHRVRMTGKEERYSVGIFTFIMNLMVEVPEKLVDEDHPLQYKPFDNFKFLNYSFTEEGMKSNSAIKSYCGL